MTWPSASEWFCFMEKECVGEKKLYKSVVFFSLFFVLVMIIDGIKDHSCEAHVTTY